MPGWLAAGWLVGWFGSVRFGSTTILAGHVVDPFRQLADVDFDRAVGRERRRIKKPLLASTTLESVLSRHSKRFGPRLLCMDPWMIFERVTIRGANTRAKSWGEPRFSYGELNRNTWNPSYLTD